MQPEAHSQPEPGEFISQIKVELTSVLAPFSDPFARPGNNCEIRSSILNYSKYASLPLRYLLGIKHREFPQSSCALPDLTLASTDRYNNARPILLQINANSQEVLFASFVLAYAYYARKLLLPLLAPPPPKTTMTTKTTPRNDLCVCTFHTLGLQTESRDRCNIDSPFKRASICLCVALLCQS